jgi:hypothetical protein
LSVSSSPLDESNATPTLLMRPSKSVRVESDESSISLVGCLSAGSEIVFEGLRTSVLSAAISVELKLFGAWMSFSKTIVVSPICTSLPEYSGNVPATGAPFSLVPLAEPRSCSQNESPSCLISACRRDANASGIQISLRAERPMVVRRRLSG